MNHPDDEGTSRHRRKGVNKDRTGTRRTWTQQEEEALVNGLKALVVSGWKCDNGFRNGYLAQLESHMLKAFPGCGLRAEPHITSKIHVWKRQYSCLVGLMSKSGLGWDGERNMITIEEEGVWEDYVKVDPTVKTMRYKTWPYFRHWCEIFGKDRATGGGGQDGHLAASQIRAEENVDTEECYVPTAEWNPDIGFVGDCEDPPLSQNQNVDPTFNSSSATKRTTTSSRKRKADDLVPELPQLVQIVNNFCETANNRIGALTRVLENEFGDPDQRGLVLDSVKQLPGVDENEVLLVSQRLMNRPKDFELFCKLSMDSKVKMVKLILDGRL